MNSLDPIIQLLQGQRARIGNEWAAELMALWAQQYPAINEDELRLKADSMLEQLADLMSACGSGPVDLQGLVAASSLAEFAKDFSADCAKNGFKPKDCAQYLLVLKNILAQHLSRNKKVSERAVGKCLRLVDEVLDGLSLQTFEAFVETRERLVADQSLEMQEVTMQVTLLWKSVLLMHLAGMIDTVKAQRFTERLLEAITRHEASVALVDLTAIPVFDASGARYIMKAVEAARILGSHIVLIGVTPEANRHMTEQGVNFDNVISRSTMRAGVAEALRLVGRRIDTVAVAGR